jgi:hypothetical protein
MQAICVPGLIQSLHQLRLMRRGDGDDDIGLRAQLFAVTASKGSPSSSATAPSLGSMSG